MRGSKRTKPAADTAGFGEPVDGGAIDRWYLRAVMFASIIAGVAFAIWVPHGLPYDEPSHWLTVRYWGTHWSMPVLGDPGVTYTAEHPPGVYVIGGMIQRSAQWFGLGPSGQLTAVRLVFGLALPASVVVLDRILRRIRLTAIERAIGLTLFALAPINLAIFWSVQNDGFLVLVCLIAIAAVLRWSEDDGATMTTRHLAVLGLLFGAAFLVKITAFFVVIAIASWVVWRQIRLGATLTARGDRRLTSQLAGVARSLVVMGMATLLVCGWWFVWNFAMYGTITGSRMHTGLPSPVGAGVTAPSSFVSLVRSPVTYLWTPNEYFRNTVALAAWAQILVALATVLLVIGVAWDTYLRVRVFWPQEPQQQSAAVAAADWEWRLCAGVSVAAIAGWAILFLFVETFPARIGVTGLVLFVGVGGATGASRLPRSWKPVVLVVCVATLLAACVWAALFAHRQVASSTSLMAILPG